MSAVVFNTRNPLAYSS